MHLSFEFHSFSFCSVSMSRCYLLFRIDKRNEDDWFCCCCCGLNETSEKNLYMIRAYNHVVVEFCLHVWMCVGACTTSLAFSSICQNSFEIRRIHCNAIDCMRIWLPDILNWQMGAFNGKQQLLIFIYFWVFIQINLEKKYFFKLLILNKNFEDFFFVFNSLLNNSYVKAPLNAFDHRWLYVFTCTQASFCFYCNVINIFVCLSLSIFASLPLIASPLIL